MWKNCETLELLDIRMGGFIKQMNEEEVRERARYKDPNELMEQQARQRIRMEKMSYKDRW